MAAQGSRCLPSTGCPNEACSCFGNLSGNIVRAGFDRRGPRFRCTECRHTFSPFANPLVDHLRQPSVEKLLDVTVDYIHGRPVREIASAHCLAPATVQRLLARASMHAERFAELLSTERSIEPERITRYRAVLRWRRRRRGRMSCAQRLRVLQAGWGD